MRQIVAKSSIIAFALWQGCVVEAGPDWIEDDHGDAGSTLGTSQPTQGSGAGGLTRISGTLAGPAGVGVGFGGTSGDFEDMYLIRIDDPANFCATTVPCGANCGGSATFDTQLWLFDANGLGLVGNNDTAVTFLGSSPVVTGSTLGPFACDETNAVIPAPGLYYIAITQHNVPLNGGGPLFNFDDFATCGPGEISGPDGPGGGMPIVGWTTNVVDYDIQVLGGQAGNFATSFTVGGTETSSPQVASNQGTLVDPSPFGDWNMSWDFGTDADGTSSQAHVGSGFTFENTMSESAEGGSDSLRFVVNLKLNINAPSGPALVGGNAAITLLTRPSELSNPGVLSSIEGPVWTGLINGESAASLFAHPYTLSGSATPVSGSTSVANATVPVFLFEDGVDSVGIRLEFDLTAGEKATFNGIFAVTPLGGGIAGATGGLPGQYVIALCGTSPAIQQVELDMDIKPGGCPNPFNPGSNGVLPVSILGTSSFDVGNVVLSSVRMSRPDGMGGSIGSVAPHEGPPGPHSTYEDTGTPFGGDACACHNLGGDGITDLSMKFVSSVVADQLQLADLPVGSDVEIHLTGELTSGEDFIARDCIRLVGHPQTAHTLMVRSAIAGAWVDVSAADVNLDAGGFGTFLRGYDAPTTVTVSAQAPPVGYVFRGWQVKGLKSLIPSATLQLNVHGPNGSITPVYDRSPNSIIADP